MGVTPVISTESPLAAEKSLTILSNGGIIIFPTDTVYGIGCSAFISEAIERIFIVKGRDFNKALPILVSGHDQLEMIAGSINSNAKNLIQAFWPGPLTIIIFKNPSLPANLSPFATVGVRMPNLPWLLELINETGPLANTSANPSGKPEARNVDDVLRTLDGMTDLIIDGGQSASTQPSTVVDCHESEIKILREGPISRHAILSALE